MVDIGCGAGHAVGELAGLGYQAIGVDVNADALAIARERLPDNDFHEASADNLPVADGSVHGCRAVRVIDYVPDAALMFAEARRVLAPGARVVVAGHDYRMAAIESDDRGQAERIVRAVESASNPANAGRHYRSMMLDAGFRDVVVRVETTITTDHELMAPSLQGMARAAVADGTCTQDEADAWLAEQADRGKRDRFLVAWPLFFAVGTR